MSKAKLMRKSFFKDSYKSQQDQTTFPYSKFDLSLSDMVDLVNENMLTVHVFCRSRVSSLLTFSPLELKETPRPPTDDIGKVQRVFTSARSVRACLQLLRCPVS